MRTRIFDGVTIHDYGAPPAPAAPRSAAAARVPADLARRRELVAAYHHIEDDAVLLDVIRAVSAMESKAAAPLVLAGSSRVEVTARAIAAIVQTNHPRAEHVVGTLLGRDRGPTTAEDRELDRRMGVGPTKPGIKATSTSLVLGVFPVSEPDVKCFADELVESELVDAIRANPGAAYALALEVCTRPERGVAARAGAERARAAERAPSAVDAALDRAMGLSSGRAGVDRIGDHTLVLRTGAR